MQMYSFSITCIDKCNTKNDYIKDSCIKVNIFCENLTILLKYALHLTLFCIDQVQYDTWLVNFILNRHV